MKMGKKKSSVSKKVVPEVTNESDAEDTIDTPQTDEIKKPKVRARKLFHPFMSNLKAYNDFAKDLPRRFMEFDEAKLNEKEESDDEGSDEEEKGESQDEVPEENNSEKLRFGSATRAKTIAELKDRLATLKGKKLDYQDRLKKKGIKSRLTKKQRLEERAKLRKEKMKQKKVKGNLTKQVPKEEAEEKVEVKPKVEPKIMFGKLELTEEDQHQKKANKDPKRLLQKIQKSELKLKSLEEKGRTETVKKIKEKLAWNKAIQKAEGVKVKDDVELLKKTIKRKTEIKNKSKKKWDQRLEAIEHRKQETQKKRKENLSKRTKDKKQKKIKKSIKKGRVVI